MKKTATVTHNNAYNYGSFLQMFALQKSIIKLGYDNEVINYKNPFYEKMFSPIHIGVNLGFVKSLYFYKEIKRRNEKFEEFFLMYIRSTKSLTKRELSELEYAYDVFITGSDQVWNYSWNQEDATYFLDFVRNVKKISYAASFGVKSILEKHKSEIKLFLQDFSKISVREKSAINIVQELIGYQVNCDIDPVFLLDTEEWKKLPFDKKKSNKYIFAYLLDEKGKEYVRKISEVTGFEVVYVGYDLPGIKKYGIGFRQYIDCGPLEWLSLVYNAQLIVTGSFHALAFSLIFNKDFFVHICNSWSSRIEDLLDLMNIDGRILNEKCDFEKEIMIDWQDVNKRIAVNRKCSLDNLKMYLD